jgi:hypothetical protein
MNKAMREWKGEDEVWIINCDRMKNYKGYFSGDNACELMEKFKLAPRLEKQREQIKN